MKFYRSDFKKVNLEQGKYYYQIKTQIIEIDLEPCAGGFCVAIYYRNTVFDEWKLYFPKQCTNHEGYDQSYNSLIGERRQETWDEALKIAGELFEKLP